ncbi:MAG: DNA methylase [Bacteroidales bacterium]|nr:DNA methylase [Bacteroidales bacterium]
MWFSYKYKQIPERNTRPGGDYYSGSLAIFASVKPRTYIAIDLKSFYASVECVDRGLDPLNTHLVVADASRTQKTICLAVTPSLKSYGIPGRARLFEVVQAVGRINTERRRSAPGRRFRGGSSDHAALLADPSLELQYIVATPRMAHYMEISGRIYGIYLRYFAPEDIHVYSIDEVFIDATAYLGTYKLSPHDLTRKIIQEVLRETGITATAGIAPNLYLCKIAMDIEAKHIPADKDGVRIAELDEQSYRRKYWTHRPLTDFWRVGHGIAARLEAAGLYTMGDIARCSVGQPWERYNEDVLYKIFGVNAELLIDHAWGWEPCTMADIKAYRPSANSLSIGQVLSAPYPYDKAKLIVREMTDQLVLDLVDKGLVTDQLTLSVGYDTSNAAEAPHEVLGGYRRTKTGPDSYQGPISTDWYGRPVPKPAHGSTNLPRPTSSTRLVTDAMMELFDRIVAPDLSVRRVYVVAAHVVREDSLDGVQLDLFEEPAEDASRERSRQEAILAIRRKFGKNAILKGMNFDEGATARERNEQIGGHKA